MITAILLAAGYSRRFGKNKLLVSYKNMPLIEHVLLTLSAAPFEQLILVERDKLYQGLAIKYNFTPVENPHASLGQGTSVALGAKHANPNNSLMFFSSDQPLITPDTINTLIKEHRKFPDRIIVPRVNEKNKMPAIFPSSFKEELSSLKEDQGGRQIIKSNPEKVNYVSFTNQWDFFDIDCPKDLDKLINH